MKKLLFSLSLLASLATIAGESEIDCSAQTFGVLPVSSTETNVIVSVPWVQASSSSATNAIPVADIIKTANLTAGDWIRVWDNDNKRYKVWNLVLNGTTGVLEWEAGGTVTQGGVVSAGDSSDTTLKRGEALILYRKNAATKPVFYVYGQYTSEDAESVTCAKAAEVSGKMVKAYTLIAPPSTSDTLINSLNAQNVGSEDYLTYSLGDGSVARAYYNSEAAEGQKWGVRGAVPFGSKKGTKGTWIPAPATTKIAAGQGVWFTSCETNTTSSAAVFSWK